MHYLLRTFCRLLLVIALPLLSCGRPSSQPIQECGNLVVEGREQCDGTELGGASCESLGAGAGTLACHDYCAYDTGDCASPLPGSTP